MHVSTWIIVVGLSLLIGVTLFYSVACGTDTLSIEEMSVVTVDQLENEFRSNEAKANYERRWKHVQFVRAGTVVHIGDRFAWVKGSQSEYGMFLYYLHNYQHYLRDFNIGDSLPPTVCKIQGFKTESKCIKHSTMAGRFPVQSCDQRIERPVQLEAWHCVPVAEMIKRSK